MVNLKPNFGYNGRIRNAMTIAVNGELVPAPVLHRDYETRSTIDLRKVGAHVYAAHPTTEVLLARFAFDEEEPWEWRPGQPAPRPVVDHIHRGGKIEGHNASFEAAIDQHIMGPRHGFPIPSLQQLECSMARCAIQALPLDLARACKALNLPFQKDEAGHRLMLKMCKPRKPRKDEETVCQHCYGSKIEEVYGGNGNILELVCSACNGTGERVYWHDSPEEIARLSEYCAQDVRAERALGKALFPMSASERRVWELDWKINNRGVRIDIDFVNAALELANKTTERLDAELHTVTNGYVEKATQVDKLKDFAKEHGVEFQLVEKTRRNGEEYEAEAADKEALTDLLETELPPAVRRAFEIRLEAGKSSVKKLGAFGRWCGADGRARGNLQYHGAGPGRWAGRGIQLQNLRRQGVDGKHGGWDTAYRDLAELDNETLELVWGSPLDLISRMMRGAVVAEPGHELFFADLSQIEARGTVWSAGQDDVTELFRSGGKVYEEMASYIFNISVDEVIARYKANPAALERFCGKESVLGCGYGVGAAAFARNAKKKARLIVPFEIALRAVHGWRDKNYKVVELWGALEDAAKAALDCPGQIFKAGPFSFRKKGNWLQLRLPSGRIIWYRRPSIKPRKEDLENCEEGELPPRFRWKIHYWGVNGVTKQWQEETTWGGKLLENGIQGMCRDIIAEAMLCHEADGYPPILSVHDEVIAEVPIGFGSVEEFISIMVDTKRHSPWADGLPVKAEGGRGLRYAKG